MCKWSSSLLEVFNVLSKVFAETPILQELNRHIASQRAATSRVICTRFIFLHMSYSPSSVIPPNIAAFPVRILSIPAQVNALYYLFNFYFILLNVES